MRAYITVRNCGKFEYEDRKSVFIAEAAPVKNEDEAIDFISYVKKKYPDAKHHVYAYVLRENSIMRYSDDGEPQGTAGMPILETIQKNGCTDIAVAVVRYFGGVLLGTGGLLRAYTAAASGAIGDAQIVTYDIYLTVKILVSYADYQKILATLNEYGFKNTEVKYTDSVAVFGKIKKSVSDSFFKTVFDVTAGRATINTIEEKFDC